MTITKNTRSRLYEIAFADILDHIGNEIGNEKMDYFLEHFCRVFSIDYTSLSILKNMYARKMLPNKKERALFAIATKLTLSRLNIDYRTLRKYRREWELNGHPEMQPRVVNEFLKPVIESFVRNYLRMSYDNLFYLNVLKDLDADE